MAGLIVVAAIAFGASVTVGTAAMLLALCLVPPAIVLLLWHDVLPPTVAQVLQQGITSPEHAGFVARLQAKAAGGG